MKKLYVTVAIMLFATAIFGAQNSGEQYVRRFLLSAGANNGGRDKVVLRYAVSDATAFANVLIDMGGVQRNNALILADPSRHDLLDAIDNINQMMVSGNRHGVFRNEVFVYYSGHADEDGLKLAGETLTWTEFRRVINNLEADVRVAVIDACGSGAITRTKGGIARPAFLSDASIDMRGYAFLTSSNENEASQESDRIRGSYFTHALLSGMRGAADMTGNGMVTINEAYQYAFNETIERTQNTRAGTQHPSRDMNLAGTGDIVMTDLRQTSATLSLDADIEGRFFIRDENGTLFAELRKMRGRPVELGIPPGRYTVQMEAPSRMWSAGEVVVAHGGTTAVSMQQMRPMIRRSTVARGEYNTEDLDSMYIYEDEDELVADMRYMMDEKRAQLSEPEESALAAEKISLLDSACAAEPRSRINAMVISNEPESGTHVSFANMANAEFCGTQIGFFNARTRDGRGSQFAYVNLSNEDFDGLQFGTINAAKIVNMQFGSLNIAGNAREWQAGAMNITNNADGSQIGAMNFARDIGGSQIGAMNFAVNVGSVQAGLMNIAGEVGSRQVGVVNIAKYSDNAPIGLLNIVGNGIQNMSVYANSAGDVTYSLRLGMPAFYTLIEWSLLEGISEETFWPLSRGWGFGTHFGMNGKFAANLDFVWSQAYKDRNDWNYWNDWNDDKWEDDEWEFDESFWATQLFTMRAGVSYRPIPYIAITAGISLNANIESNKYPDTWRKPEQSLSWYSSRSEDYYVHAWPGVYVGLTLGKTQATFRERQR